MRVLRALLTIGAFGVLALAATPFLDRLAPTWLPAVQALGRVWLVVALVLGVFSVLTKAWLAVAANVVAIAAALVTIVGISNAPACKSTEDRIAVMSINAFYGEADVAQLAAAVERYNIDVLVIPEVTEMMIADLKQTKAGKRFTYRSGQTVETRDSSGTVILSRYPAERVPETAESKTVTFQQPIMRISVGEQSVLFKAVHPLPPLPKWLDLWHDGLLELGQWQRSHRGVPLILAGDFNASMAHAPFRDAKRSMSDTSGLWPPATWPMDRRYPAFTDIDHILVRNLSVVDSGVVDIDGTDHRAVWADLRVCRV
ncbi:MAG TPA: endonuclease/exonuclease/phosphatase family protein [Aeromicrobium sp.]|nr:endonuclease/exonuclease/phosphatase family protein [Aeromicrobium sp.]